MDDINSSTAQIMVTISVIGKGVVNTFISDYTLIEHWEQKPLRDGKIKAEEVLHLHPSNYAVTCSAVTNLQIDRAVRKLLSIDENHILLNKVHNPLHNCWSGYKSVTVLGHKVLVAQFSGFCAYAVVNCEWVQEMAASYSNCGVFVK
jgi:hypothetical protein